MTDRQLSTRDLAARSDSDETDSSPESQQPTDDATGLSATSAKTPGLRAPGRTHRWHASGPKLADHRPPTGPRARENARSAGTEHQPRVSRH